MNRMSLAMAAIFAPFSAQAAERIELSSDVFVEKIFQDTNGRQKVILEKPVTVVPGDRLIFVLKYRNVGDSSANDVTVTNPMPTAVSFQETLDGTELVSVNGGRSWNRLQNIRVREPDGRVRSAVPEDVTHIRWNLSNAISGGSQGKLTFRGVVK